MYNRYMTPPLSPEEITRRDHLARHRTHLANERTLLAYLRTAASFIVLGAALIHFLEDKLGRIFGWTSLGLGLGILAIGTLRFLNRHHRIRHH